MKVRTRKLRSQKNGEKTEWSPYDAQQLGNDDDVEDWDKEAAEYWEALSILRTL